MFFCRILLSSAIYKKNAFFIKKSNYSVPRCTSQNTLGPSLQPKLYYNNDIYHTVGNSACQCKVKGSSPVKLNFKSSKSIRNKFVTIQGIQAVIDRPFASFLELWVGSQLIIINVYNCWLYSRILKKAKSRNTMLSFFNI